MKNILTILGLAGMLALPFAAQAQLTSPRISTLANNQLLTNSQVLAIGTSTNLLSTFAYMHDLSVETTITSTNAVGTMATVTNYFDVCLDAAPGTNWTTTLPITTTATCNGTTTVRSVTVIPKTSFDGAQQIRLTKTGTGAANNINVTVRLSQVP
jgi:DNA-binding transcriptional regulator LsrR (DeoR family)